MKKQTNPSIKAHLIRSAFYVLLLLAVCVIPFALAQRNQRNIGKRSQNVARSSLKQQTQAGKESSFLPQGVCPVPWAFVADMPLDLEATAGASDGTYFYAAGGFSFSTGDNSDTLYRYNPSTNAWDQMASMPQALAMGTAVYYPTTNKIYVFGGADFNSGDNFDTTFIYDIATNMWSSGAAMPDVRSFSAGGYVSSTGKIYILSGYNTGFVDSAQPNTWEYDPVANTWNDLTATVPYPHPAGGFAYGVINNKLYTAGGRDANNDNINDTWEFDPAGPPAYAQKADMPGSQPNVPGSAVAIDALFTFGGGNPFLASVPASAANIATDTRSPRAPKAAPPSTKAAPVKAFDPAIFKHRPLLPTTTGRTNVYIPAQDAWRRSANLNTVRAFTSGAFISGSNEILCAGGEDGFSTLASAEVTTPCIPPTPTPCPPTPTPSPGCGILVASGLTLGFEPNGYQQIASNTVNYTFNFSHSAPNEFAIFETHDPWGFTVLKDAITAAGHTYTVFTPADLAGFDFSQYRVVVLNWDDTFVTDFGGNAACGGVYIDALPALEAYSAAGGVVWVQGATQSFGTDCYPLPFGGQACTAFGNSDPIVDPCSAMMINVDDPIEGNSASHVSQTGLPGDAHIVVLSDADNNPVLYDLTCATPQPTPTPTPQTCNSGLIHNGGFETGNLADWTVDGTPPDPLVLNVLPHSGRFSAFLGGNAAAVQFCGFGTEIPGDSSFYQEFGPVLPNTTLSFWHWDCTSDSITFDWQDAYITDTQGNILLTIYHQCSNNECWINQTVDLSPWVGQTIRVKFLVHQDSAGDLTSMFVDDVAVSALGPCAPTATPTPRATPAPRKRPTPPPR
jgi:N-acetylneuraminic acid mutarotase